MSTKKKAARKAPARSATPGPAATLNDITPETFILVWNSRPTASLAAAALGMSRSTCSNYAARLRAAGYELKVFPKGRPRLLKI